MYILWKTINVNKLISRHGFLMAKNKQPGKRSNEVRHLPVDQNRKFCMRQMCAESWFGLCVFLRAVVWAPVHYSWGWGGGGRAEQCWSVSWLNEWIPSQCIWKYQAMDHLHTTNEEGCQMTRSYSMTQKY